MTPFTGFPTQHMNELAMAGFDPFIDDEDYNEFVGGFYDPGDPSDPTVPQQFGVSPSLPTPPSSQPGRNPLIDRFLAVAQSDPSRMSLGQKLGGVVRAGLKGAGQPNIAGGGPADIIRAIGGGMDNAQADRLLIEKLQTGRQGRELGTIADMMEQDRRMATAEAQQDYYRSQQATQEARQAQINATANNPYVMYNTGGQGVVAINKNNPNDYRVIGAPPPNKVTNEHDQKYNAYLSIVSEQESRGVPTEKAQNMASIFVYGKPLIAPPSRALPKPMTDDELSDAYATETDPRKKSELKAKLDQRINTRKLVKTATTTPKTGAGPKPNAKDRVSQAYSVLTGRFGTLSEKNVQQFIDAAATDPAFANIRVDLDKYLRSLKDKMDARNDRNRKNRGKGALAALDDVDI